MGRLSGILFCLIFSITTVFAYDLYKDHTQDVEARVQDLLKRMTLAEKIGQMIQIERIVANYSVIKDYYIGSIISDGGSAPEPKASVDTWQNMIDHLQAGAIDTRLQIPMIYAIDAVHGHNNVYGAVIFPHNIGLGCTRDPDLVNRIGAATALEVRATGISYVFAPCIAWGRCYESYSEDTEVIRSMTDIIYGLQGVPKTPDVPFVKDGSKVVACAKHYLGDGGTTLGINDNNTVIDYKDLVYLLDAVCNLQHCRSARPY